MYQSLSSQVPTADELLALELWQLGAVLLAHLKSHEGSTTGVVQNGLISFPNFIASQNPTGSGQKAEYGDKQPEVNRALSEAWNWLEKDGIVIRDLAQPAPWFRISRRGEELLRKRAKFDHWDQLGLDRVKSDLTNTRGTQVVGGPPPNQELAWEWVRMKEAHAKAGDRRHASTNELTFISVSRLAELGGLVSTEFDFRKLIRLCEEINIAYSSGCYFATGMLTRGLLDHVPPLFE